jgi:hypothetical protein
MTCDEVLQSKWMFETAFTYQTTVRINITTETENRIGRLDLLQRRTPIPRNGHHFLLSRAIRTSVFDRSTMR